MSDDPIRFDGLSYNDLRGPAGLQRLDERFRVHLEQQDPELLRRLVDFRQAASTPPALEHSQLLLDLAPHVEAFIAALFGIDAATREAGVATAAQNPPFAFQQEVVQKRTKRLWGKVEEDFADLDAWLDDRLKAHGIDRADRELAVGELTVALAADRKANKAELDRLAAWAVRARETEEGRAVTGDWVSFRTPDRVDVDHLVPVRKATDKSPNAVESPGRFRARDGFELTDPRMSAREAQGEVNYCIYCHDHDGDFCSKGFPEKKGQPELGFKVSAIGNTLHGCPLEEKISEMDLLKRDGYTIAPLATAMVDNPMVPATGHRICNDCMKSCIFQKQQPVNVPQIETRVLTDVLDLPWGVEVYDLLTRWNPLRHEQYVQKAYNGKKVLVAGMGPAGFTMAHHLTMEGCAVVGVDGLKIEPLPEEFRDRPIRDYAELEEPLDRRINYGFGGVAEYGITVRWDKNFLKLIYLTLARRETFQVFGGVRLGGTLTLEDAWALGFHHVCNASGAGLPRVIQMGNSLARGMRQANDFLMALQLTGAAKQESLANLQVRLPAVVIGGGLTAIDTATELQAYYIQQVEKALDRHERLAAVYGEESLWEKLDEENAGILEELLAHGRAVRAERERAAAEGRKPDFLPLLREWGGVTVAYRRPMNESPSYKRNHEEVVKALEEGIYFEERLEPIHAVLDRFGHVQSLQFRRRRDPQGKPLSVPEDVELPARGIFVAAGTVPNTIYEREHPGTAELEDNHYRPYVHHRHELQAVDTPQHCKEEEFGPFTSYRADGRYMTFLGDTHPAFSGSVVNAIASGLRTYPHVMTALRDQGPVEADWVAYRAFRERMEYMLAPRVSSMDASHPAVVELRVRAPMAARNFRPGQFFRMQTFESHVPKVADTRLQVPLQTVSGAGVEGDLMRLFVLKGGIGGRLSARLKPGDPLVLMGPTGAPTEMGSGKTIMVVAGRWGAAVMLALGPALRAAGNRVIYFGAFRRAEEPYYREQLEAATDQIVWATADGEPIPASRPQDISVSTGDAVDLIRRYGDGELSGPEAPHLPLGEVDEVLVMGSTGLLYGMQQALSPDGALAPYFREGVEIQGTAGSPMQCMLKGVCSQCLQWQVDPETGRRTQTVFSCAEQDQPLLALDLENLWARQTQNRLPDMMADLWLNHLLEGE
ncbi:pyridine nucleotide-disulfide oxidoreductase [Thiohalorhabdus methylotrophus]|uniref:Pyridine nucleotide-disulfide oxidoreductase n=1 Tax=Thiohalorhabdus methylotrophus TaxID=3242694 RepID=A0ABV4TSN3_9GAMM